MPILGVRGQGALACESPSIVVSVHMSVSHVNVLTMLIMFAHCKCMCIYLDVKQKALWTGVLADIYRTQV